MYVWKAEAQERGDIHFHMVIDSFIDHRKARKLWYKRLQTLNLMGDVPLEKASRIVWLQAVTNMHGLKFELAGYFASKRDKYGRLMFKHYTVQGKEESREDFQTRITAEQAKYPLCRQCYEHLRCEECTPLARKENQQHNEVFECQACEANPPCGSCRIIPIREIEGNSWGRSDELNYPPPTVTGITYQQEEAILRDALWVKSDKEKMPGVQVAVYRDYIRYQCKKTGERKRFLKVNEFGAGLHSINAIWHLEKAIAVYHPGRELPTGLKYYITENQSYNIKTKTLCHSTT